MNTSIICAIGTVASLTLALAVGVREIVARNAANKAPNTDIKTLSAEERMIYNLRSGSTNGYLDFLDKNLLASK